MTVHYTNLVNRSFKHIGPRNPLRELDGTDRTLLFSLLFLYRSDRAMPHRSIAVEAAEEMSKIAADSAVLAQRIRSVMIEGKFALPLDPFLPGLQGLPSQLERFGKRLDILMTSMAGKKGHKQKTTVNRFLVMASELVRLRTGDHHDEHLAELLQAINPDAEPDMDHSGDAIRKKRHYLQNAYPTIYSHAIRQLGSLAAKNSRNDLSA